MTKLVDIEIIRKNVNLNINKRLTKSILKICE